MARLLPIVLYLGAAQLNALLALYIVAIGGPIANGSIG